MASEWEMAMGVELNMGMRSYSNASSNVCTQPMNSSSCYSSVPHLYSVPSGEALRVDDLLDLSNAGHEYFPTSAAAAAADNNGHLIPMTEHSGAMTGYGSRDSISSSGHQTSFQLSFANDFYIPSEEAAELEWLSKFVDDSYSDIPNYPSSSAAAAAHATMMAASNGNNNHLAGGTDNSVATPGRGARSKRSRATAAVAAAWHSLIPRPQSQSSPSSSSSSSDLPSSKPMKGDNSHCSRGRKNVVGGGNVGTDIGIEGGVRRCTHCSSEKTPQWRTGPLGPKTLCNACGVRYKSGRLMPEYRPAASPTYVLTHHSNSHRKVMELRRQKELMLLRGSHLDSAAVAASAVGGSASQDGRPELLFRDYGVC